MLKMKRAWEEEMDSKILAPQDQTLLLPPRSEEKTGQSCMTLETPEPISIYLYLEVNMKAAIIKYYLGSLLLTVLFPDLGLL